MIHSEALSDSAECHSEVKASSDIKHYGNQSAVCVHKQQTSTDFSAMNATYSETISFVKWVLETSLETDLKLIPILNDYKNEFILLTYETTGLVLY